MFSRLLQLVLLIQGLGVLGAVVPRIVAPQSIIIDTDLLNFPDDVGALGIANVLQTRGKANIIGIASNLNSTYIPGGIDAINTYYHHPDIPIALNLPHTNLTYNPYYTHPTPDYITYISNQNAYPYSIDSIYLPVDLYRHLLSSSPDNSVTIAAIGFFNNLYSLYHSPPDQVSKLSGADLIKQKVKELVIQGGNFANISSNTTGAGYNLSLNLTESNIVQKWPTNVTFLGSDIGASVYAGLALNNASEANPIKAVYRINQNSSAFIHEDRCQDLVATYYSIVGTDDIFTYSAPGSIAFTPGANASFRPTMKWTPNVSGSNLRYLILKNQTAGIKKLNETINGLLGVHA